MEEENTKAMENKVVLNSADVISFLVCSLVGVELIRLPNTLATSVQQDAWIPALLGAIYPLYIILLCNYIAKKFPCNDLIDISKNLFGKILGTILILIFSIQFIVYIPQMISDVIYINYVYISLNLTPIKIAIFTGILIFYSATKGLKVLSKVSTPIIILTLLLMLMVTFPVKYGSMLNLMPVLNTKLSKILNASLNTAYSYTTLELILLIHPFVKNKENLKRDSLIALIIVVVLYTWAVIINIYLFGVEIVSKTSWPLIFNSESLVATVLSSFRYVFLFLWSPNAYITLAIEYYLVSYIFSRVFNYSVKKINIILLPIFIITSLLIYRLNISDFIKTTMVPLLVIFNIVYITSISVITYIKTKKAGQSNNL